MHFQIRYHMCNMSMQSRHKIINYLIFNFNGVCSLSSYANLNLMHNIIVLIQIIMSDFRANKEIVIACTHKLYQECH